jgi:hypothetical protein
MPSDINEYLNSAGPDCKRRLIKTYANEVEQFSYLVGKIKETLAEFSYRRSSLSDPSRRDIAFGLMYKCVNTLMAGFELALSGYYWEPPILHRNAVEGCAAAWDIALNDKSFELWQGKKHFKSADSIARLSKEDNFFGKFWGHLSNQNVHTTQLNSSPTFFTMDGTHKFQVFGYVPEGKEETRRFVIEISVFAADVCLNLTEMVFFPFALQPETLVKSENDGHVRRHTSERMSRFREAFEQTCRKMMSDPDASF